MSPTRLTPVQQVFVTEYLRNGFNGRRAYLAGHPTASVATADQEACRYLSIPKVRRWLQRRLEVVWKRRRMEGDQALARIATIAAFDVRNLFDEQGQLLPPQQWPESAVGVIRGFHLGEKGTRVQLESAHTALRTILELEGKLRTPGESMDALADAIRADLASHAREDR